MIINVSVKIKPVLMPDGQLIIAFCYDEIAVVNFPSYTLQSAINSFHQQVHCQIFVLTMAQTWSISP
jgi:hypothetical protein